MSLEKYCDFLTSNTIKFQKDTRNVIKSMATQIGSLDMQVGQLATTMGKLESQSSGKLPSQSLVNPKENVSAITLRSGKQLEETSEVRKKIDKDLRLEEDEATTSHEENPAQKVISKPSIPTYNPLFPFPTRFAQTKKEESEKKILDIFRKVYVNIPLLDVIKQVPRYAKFVKELCTNKRKLKGNKVVSVRENILNVLQRKLPPKCKDLGSFTIPCIIGNTCFNKVMLDL